MILLICCMVSVIITVVTAEKMSGAAMYELVSMYSVNDDVQVSRYPEEITSLQK